MPSATHAISVRARHDARRLARCHALRTGEREIGPDEAAQRGRLHFSDVHALIVERNSTRHDLRSVPRADNRNSALGDRPYPRRSATQPSVIHRRYIFRRQHERADCFSARE
jgi:hypothetical protein